MPRPEPINEPSGITDQHETVSGHGRAEVRQIFPPKHIPFSPLGLAHDLATSRMLAQEIL